MEQSAPAIRLFSAAYPAITRDSESSRRFCRIHADCHADAVAVDVTNRGLIRNCPFWGRSRANQEWTDGRDCSPRHGNACWHCYQIAVRIGSHERSPSYACIPGLAERSTWIRRVNLLESRRQIQAPCGFSLACVLHADHRCRIKQDFERAVLTKELRPWFVRGIDRAEM